ncbi:MAG: single-stranded-DNA-specific exonuclease RecJ [Patescibacteria group bacterium]|nr:single-stranded-DNA-specific exonuclease RecJ [Patescibacteria group bacterium]
MTKRYRVREEASPEAHTMLLRYPEFMRRLLLSRGITSAEEAERFISPSFEGDSHDPFLLPDMEQAARRLIEAAHGHEYICVWSDYDCDGIPGGVALAEFLRSIGCSVRHYIPHRHEEGYGLNKEGLEILAAEGVGLVITVDLGTTDHEQVIYAQGLGMEVIVTDHHLPQATLPPALAIINPHRTDSTYPFKELCGGGVAWKLVQAILLRERSLLPEGKERWLLDLVGLSTLSDMVPLQGENRMLASYGLLVMRKSRRAGLRALLRTIRVKQETLTEDDVAFMVTPRINAASRMGSPEIAAELLSTTSEEEGLRLALRLEKLNDERKGAVASTVKEARSRLRKRGGVSSPLIVMGNPLWRPGILGLVANALVESEGVPVFLWGREGGETLKGSCRSDGSINVVEVMGAAREFFEDFGGHEFSGGFSLKEERAHELPERLNEAFIAVRAQEGKERETLIDAELTLEDAPQALRHLRLLSPFGTGNKKPIFLFPSVSVSRVRTFGKKNDHLEVGLARGGAELSGVSFFSTPDSFQKKISLGLRVDVIGHVEQDFRGRPRLRVVDIL